VLYTGDGGIVDYSNSGDSNFVVQSYGNSSELVINENGPITGTTPLLTPGRSILAIQAQGDWSLTERP
jgi:hypothetical protein